MHGRPRRPGLRAQLPILSAWGPKLAQRKRQLPQWLGKFPEYKIPATKILQPEGPTGAGNNSLCNTGASCTHRGQEPVLCWRGWGGASGRPAVCGEGGHRACRLRTHGENSLPRVTLRGTFPLCPRWAQWCLSGAGTRSSSHGDSTKSGPGPGLTPPCIVRQATPVGPEQAGRCAAGPSFPPGRSQEGQRGAGLLWLAPTWLPGLVPHCPGGLSIPESPLWTRHCPAGLRGHNQAPEDMWQPARAPPAPGRTSGEEASGLPAMCSPRSPLSWGAGTPRALKRTLSRRPQHLTSPAGSTRTARAAQKSAWPCGHLGEHR